LRVKFSLNPLEDIEEPDNEYGLEKLKQKLPEIIKNSLLLSDKLVELKELFTKETINKKFLKELEDINNELTKYQAAFKKLNEDLNEAQKAKNFLELEESLKKLEE